MLPSKESQIHIGRLKPPIQTLPFLEYFAPQLFKVVRTSKKFIKYKNFFDSATNQVL